jgi:hypothetical protein
MITALCIWAAVAFTLYFIEFARMPKRVQFNKTAILFIYECLRGKGNTNPEREVIVQPLDRKPFNCETCLPVWLYAVFYILAIYLRDGLAIVLFVAASCTAGIITPFILKAIRK